MITSVLAEVLPKRRSQSTPVIRLDDALGTETQQALSLNNNGFVAFRLGVYHHIIYKSNGTNTYTIAADSVFGGEFQTINRTAISINDDGTVAFTARHLNTPMYRVFTSDGVSLPSQLNDVYGGRPSMSNSGVIAFIGFNDMTVKIQDGSNIYSLPDIEAYHLLDINDSGKTAFFGLVDHEYSVYIWDGVSDPQIIDCSNYQTASLGYVFDGGTPDCAINNEGLVVFGASLPLEEGSDLVINQGLFTGPDPVSDKVIQAGDLLDGVAVDYIYFSRNGLNNLGQIAFTAELSDGTTGVWVATPVPEPSTLILLAAGAIGSFAFVCRRRLLER